jgi:hypothetical protein
VERLSAAHYRGILEFLHTAGEVEDANDPFPEPVLAQLRGLVVCDVGVERFEYDLSQRHRAPGTGRLAARRCMRLYV